MVVTVLEVKDAVVAFVDRSNHIYAPDIGFKTHYISLLSSSLILIHHTSPIFFILSFIMSLATSDPGSMSTVSRHSTGSQNESQNEDWDRSESDIPTDVQDLLGSGRPTTTPRNSVIFPADDGAENTPGRMAVASQKSERTLSQLLKLHAADGTEGKFSQEEASRIAEVLGQWVC